MNLKKYQIIYADPPWRYDFCKDNADKIENHYPTMTNADICNIKVPVDDNSVLYLWATAPKLLEALEVMKAWGFKYKTQAVWDKTWVGMGYWFRGQHEILLVGVRGKFSPPIPPLRESSVYREKKSKHSKKPSYFRKLISRQFPKCTKLEMFAREKTEGWDVWGNEVKNNINLK
ncbi:MAG: MT-A70 family methyltransferase [Candidatus Moraniibacteriota bacterium]